MFSIIFGHSEEDPLLSIFCILRKHPSGIIAVFWDIGAILTLMVSNTPAVVGPVFHWRVVFLGIRRMSGNEKDPIKFTSE